MNEQGRPRVLVVDDQAEMAAVIADALVDRGYTAYAVYSGSIALELLRNQRADAVVTDLTMPRVNGLDVLRASQRLDPSRPVILMTVFGAADSALQEYRFVDPTRERPAVRGGPVMPESVGANSPGRVVTSGRNILRIAGAASTVTANGDEVVDDRSGQLVGKRRAVCVTHLVHLRSPLTTRERRLVEDVSQRVTGRTGADEHRAPRLVR
jgi:CheY-like chemotaxis protein